MPTIQIPNVPDETHTVLRQRAERAGQSLQDYVRDQLVAEASQRPPSEVFAEVDERVDNADLDIAELAQAIRDGRPRR
ncbi:MAG: hypothetical protein QM621_06880 [Aeromicrobium sp.]|uniref:FitA-like ribbon-helix-helix domain-containing protein n=1 Tax=Aeromicrobium sp. TaxID=1871063 RepID=UPI0039E4CED3